MHTEGIVVSAHNVGEADRLFSVFTRDLGLVYASGRGVRNIQSLQRYGLQLLSRVDVSFVRSRGGWRITNVTPKDSLLALSGGDMTRRLFVTRVVGLVKRLIVGEEANIHVYTALETSFAFLFDEALSHDEVETLEVITVLRLLHFLGYLKHVSAFDERMLDAGVMTKDLIVFARDHRKNAIADINRALHESQL